MAGTAKQTTATDAAIPVQYYFSVDSSPVTARRQVVSTEKCAACHQTLGFIHGGTRNSVQECVICHNPALVDGTSNQSVNFAWQIHSTHRGEALTKPYVLGKDQLPGSPKMGHIRFERGAEVVMAVDNGGRRQFERTGVE